MHFARLSALLFALILALCPFIVSAEENEDEPIPYPPLPALSDPLDQHMQSLAVIYQKDLRFDKLTYDHGRFTVRGCAPSSVANAVIAAFGVTDPDIAAGIVSETLWVLCPGSKYGRTPIDMNRLKNLLNPQMRLEAAESYPSLAASVGVYDGTIEVSMDGLSIERTQAALNAYSGEPMMTTGRLSVRNGWDRAVQILCMLHNAGHDDAALILTYAGAGTASGKAPLRTSSNGHYLTLYIHVGSFMETGRIYALDSMPRALSGEDYGPGTAYRRCYAFLEEEPDSPFNAGFTASRISPVIIRIDFSESAQAQLDQAQSAAYASEEEKQAALIALRTQLLEPFLVYSTGTAILRFPGAES